MTALTRPLFLVALVLVGTLGAWVAVNDVAEAHAILVRSSPEAGSELTESPASIDLWFSEPLEAAFSNFELLDSQGNSIRVDGIQVDPQDEYHLSGLPLGLDPGYYTVLYRNVSQADGHEWSGAFSFVVLNPDGSTPTGQAFDAGGLGRTTSPENVVGRWLSFAGFALLSGGAVLYLPLRQRRTRFPLLWAAYLRTAPRLALGGVPLALAGTVLVTIAQVEAVAGAGVWDILGGTRAGTLWLWRLLAIEAAAVLLGLVFLAQRWRRPRSGAIAFALVPLAAAGGMLTISLLSHAAAAPGSAWAQLFDFAHLLVASWWLGGVAALAVLLVVAFRGRTTRPAIPREEARALLVPFSMAAAASVYVLVATGIVRTLGEIPTLTALWESGYGRWLLVKLALVAGIVGVAFFNRRNVEDVRGGASRGDASGPVTNLRALLPVELLLGAAILLVVGVLGQTPTPRGEVVEAPVQAAQPYNGIQQIDGMNVHLQVMPASVGENNLRVHLYMADGSEPEGVSRVLATFIRPGFFGGEQTAAAPEGGGIYRVTTSALSQALTWTVRVDVTRAGADDARFDYQVPIAGAATASSGGAFGSLAPQISGGTLIFLLAAMASGGLLLLGPRQGQYRVPVHATAVIVLGIGIMASVTGGDDGSRASASNPSPADPASIARGGEVYVQNCQTCHGEQGRGDGPSAAGLTPPPADLRQHIPLHGDSELFAFVTNGIDGTAMPAWEDRLTEEQRWDVVNYLIAEYGGFP